MQQKAWAASVLAAVLQQSATFRLIALTHFSTVSHFEAHRIHLCSSHSQIICVLGVLWEPALYELMLKALAADTQTHSQSSHMPLQKQSCLQAAKLFCCCHLCLLHFECSCWLFSTFCCCSPSSCHRCYSEPRSRMPLTKEQQ